MTTSTETHVKKVSTSETGHVKNAANFEQLISYIESLNGLYNPAKEALKLPALKTQYQSAYKTLAAVNAAYTVHANAVADREAAFKSLGKLIMRASYSFKASETSDELKENITGLVKKLQGRRASPKLTEEEKKALAEKGMQKNQISSSHMSYDSRLDNLDKFIDLLSSVPQYAPNEEDLKATALKEVYYDLKAKNTTAIIAENNLVNARIARNEIFYKDKTGLVDISREVKQYLMSLDGATGPKYKAISKLRFAQIKA